MGCITRWGSNLAMYQKIQTLQGEIRAIVADPMASPYISPEMEDICLSRVFWSKLGDLITCLKPLAIAVARLEADLGISKVLKVWMELEDTFKPNAASIFSQELCELITDSLNLRWDLISEDIHSASFLLDPQFKDIAIPDKQYLDGERLIKKMVTEREWNSGLGEQFIKFRQQEGVYMPTLDTDIPYLYWQRLLGIASSSRLATISLNILKFPQSSADVERSFCAVKRVHTWQRASLRRKKVAKLVFIFVNNKKLNNQELN